MARRRAPRPQTQPQPQPQPAEPLAETVVAPSTGAIRPGKIRTYTLSDELLAFPPAADFPDGGRFHVRFSGQVQLRTEKGGDAFLFDEGTEVFEADAPEAFFLSAGRAVQIRVMKTK